MGRSKSFLPRLAYGLLAIALATAAAGQLGPHGAAPLPPSLEPASTGGIQAVDRALARLSAHRRLLVVGAHPDDEDNRLLTWVSLSGGDAAYLSLSRGEGGQNLVGSELGAPLGLLRTGELMAARRVDGARQFFTRAYDFGYTRSLEETEGRWPQEVLLEDAVRVLRRFRPQVVVAVFPPDSRAGHGQHQMSAVIARAAFEAAGAPDRYQRLTEAGLPPWAPSALFHNAWSREEVTHLFSLDEVDPFSGRSMAQVAADSRSQHRSQDMGSEQPIGGGLGGLVAIQPAAREGAEDLEDPFAGIDTRLAALAAPLPAGPERLRLEQRLESIEHLARSLRTRLSPASLRAAVPDLSVLARALDAAVADLSSMASGPEVDAVLSLLREKRAAVGSALLAAAGVAVEAVLDREAIPAGETARATLSVWNGGTHELLLSRLELAVSNGWAARGLQHDEAPKGGAQWQDPRWSGQVASVTESDAERVPPAKLRSLQLEVRVEEAGAEAQVYFLRRPRLPGGGLYDWSDVPEAVRGEPWGPPPLVAHFGMEIAGVQLELEREVVFRTGDQAVGEVRRPVRSVPGVEVIVEPEQVIRPLSSREPLAVEVRLRSRLERAVSGSLAVEGDLRAAGASTPTFELEPGGSWSGVLQLESAPAQAAKRTAEIAAVLGGGERFSAAAPVVDYPHVRPVSWYRPAVLSLHLLDLELPDLDRLGFVVGASSALPAELEAVGLPVEILDAQQLTGDLSSYDAIVIGSRAYETDPALAGANGRLLEYVRQGGLLLVLYQQYAFASGGFAPYALEIARPHGRVTDEESPVTLLEPEHPAFSAPNRIGPEDWRGWVQERGLYFADTWDPEFTPLLAMGDPGEPEQRGGLLVAPLGEGLYVYTGLAFFRQLPAGVSGAWRLFANLLSLGR